MLLDELASLWRKMKKSLLLISLFGLAIVITVPLAFYKFVGRGIPFSNSGGDWAVFGEYFGGVAGALLSFLSIILILYTIWQQSEQIKTVQKETQRSDLIKCIFFAYTEIDKNLEAKLASSAGHEVIDFGYIVRGIVASGYASQVEFSRALQRLFQLTSMYCNCIGEYKNNFDNTDSVYQIHSQKAEELLKFIEENTKLKNKEFDIQMKNCKSQLKN